MSLSKLDKAIATIEFLTKKKRERVGEMSARLDLNENQKIFIGQELEFIQATQTLLRFAKQDFYMELGKLPPQDLEVERAVLGALMIDQKAIKEVMDVKLSIHHFYTEAHKEIYKAICLINSRNQGIELLTVVNELRKLGTLEVCGGATYLVEITNKICQTIQIKVHAMVVIEHSMKRELILLGGEMIRRAYEETTDCFEIIDEFKKELLGHRFNVA